MQMVHKIQINNYVANNMDLLRDSAPLHFLIDILGSSYEGNT